MRTEKVHCKERQKFELSHKEIKYHLAFEGYNEHCVTRAFSMWDRVGDVENEEKQLDQTMNNRLLYHVEQELAFLCC